MVTIRVIATDADAGGTGPEAMQDFTLNLLAVPVPPSLTTAVTVMEVDPGTDPAAPTSGVAITAVDLGFIDENDTRLESVTFTVPAVTVGVLYRNGVAVTTSSLTLTRAELAAANLRFVPANKKAASTPSITFTTMGNNGGAITSMLNYTVPASDDAPVVVTKTAMVNGQNMTVMGIAPQNVNEGGSFSYTIQVGFEPTDDFNPVDTDDANLTFTAHIVDGNTETALRLPTHAGPDTATDWLRFDPATGRFSGTPPEGAARVMVRVRAKDARDDDMYSATSTFTLTVGGLPTFSITRVEYKEGKVNITVTSDSAVMMDTTVKVRVVASKGHVRGGDYDAPFTVGMGGNTYKLSLPLQRVFGPQGAVTVRIVDDPSYQVSADSRVGALDMMGVNMVTVTGEVVAGGEDEARNVRGQYVEHALGGFARSMGWGVVDSVRNRMSVVGAGGAMQRSAVDLSGLVDYAQTKVGADIDVDGLLALARAAGEGDSEQSAAELSGLVKDYLQSRASPEGGPVAYHEAALAVREAGEGGSSELTAAELSGLVRDYLQSGAGPESGPARAVSGAADSVWDGVQVWSSLKRDDLSFDDKGLDFKGDTTSLALGIEKALGSKGLLGVAVNWHDGKLDLADDNYALAVSGEIKMEQWSLAPYAVLATDHGRIWGSVGIGGGTLDYKDRHGVFGDTGSSDVSMNVLAAGAEYDIMETHSWELLGRVEGMSASMETGDEDDGLYGNQDVRVHGLRGEFEFAWPTVSAGGDHYRPYLTAGYRLDEGDGTGGKAFEYGGGLDVDTGDFTFSGSARLQGLEGEGDYDRRSYTYAMAYDRGRDRRGLSLSMQNSYGSAESRDYFARQVPWARSANGGLSADERSRTDMEAGYGFAVRGLLTGHSEGMLKPFVKTNLDGSAASEWSLGLTLESGFGNIGLEHKTRPATGRREDDQHEIQLNFKFDF